MSSENNSSEDSFAEGSGTFRELSPIESAHVHLAGPENVAEDDSSSSSAGATAASSAYQSSDSDKEKENSSSESED